MELLRERESEERPTGVKSGETEVRGKRFRAAKMMEVEGTNLSWRLYAVESRKLVS